MSTHTTPDTATFRVWRGDDASGQLVDYTTPVSEGMVVLDAIHQIQADRTGRNPCACNESSFRNIAIPRLTLGSSSTIHTRTAELCSMRRCMAMKSDLI